MAAADSLPDSPRSSGVSTRVASSPQQLQRLSITPAHFSPEARVQFSARLKKLAEDVDVTVGSVGGPISKHHRPICSGGETFAGGDVTILKGASQEEQGSDTDAGNDYSSHHILAVQKPSAEMTGDCKSRTQCDCIERQSSGGLSLSNMALLKYTLAPSSAATLCTLTPAAAPDASPLGANISGASALSQASLAAPMAHVTARALMLEGSDSDSIGDFIPTPAVEPCSAESAGSKEGTFLPPPPASPTHSPAAPLSLPSPASPSSHSSLHRAPLLRIPALSLLTALTAVKPTPAASSASAAAAAVAPVPAASCNPLSASASAPAPASMCDASTRVLMVPEDDGFTWRKYGQKLIRASSRPRLYFRCRQPGCLARKTEDRAADGKVLGRKYLSLHNHNPPTPSPPAAAAADAAAVRGELDADAAAVRGELDQQMGGMCSKLDEQGEARQEQWGMMGDGWHERVQVDEDQKQHGGELENWLQQQQHEQEHEAEQEKEEQGQQAWGMFGMGSDVEGLFDLSLSDAFLNDAPTDCDCSNHTINNKIWLPAEEFGGGVSEETLSEEGLSLTVSGEASWGVATGDRNEGRLSSPSCSLAMIESLLMSDVEASNNEYGWDGVFQEISQGAEKAVVTDDEHGGEEGPLDAWACCTNEAPASVKQQYVVLRTTSGPTSPTQRTATISGRAAAFSPRVTPGGSPGVSSGAAPGSPSGVRMVCAQQVVEEPRVVVAVRSDADVVDDGYHWRKYGHKLVGGNTFPRSYYRCTSGDCRVRKQVERSKHDPSMVVTTYEGRHNHSAPGPILCLPQSL
ncbi:unnamed protein product [Closterium sp. NIES-64]|nr:unnamed protein product [Closterium sp. NIES-64]